MCAQYRYKACYKFTGSATPHYPLIVDNGGVDSSCSPHSLFLPWSLSTQQLFFSYFVSFFSVSPFIPTGHILRTYLSHLKELSILLCWLMLHMLNMRRHKTQNRDKGLLFYGHTQASLCIIKRLLNQAINTHMGPHLALLPWWQLCIVPESSWWTLTVIRWVWGFVERQNKEVTHHAALINLFNKLPPFHIICPDMHLKPKRRRGSAAEINILILLLIAKCKCLFSLLIIDQYLYCGGCSVYTPHREPSVSTILTQKPKMHAETCLTVWIVE